MPHFYVDNIELAEDLPEDVLSTNFVSGSAEIFE